MHNYPIAIKTSCKLTLLLLPAPSSPAVESRVLLHLCFFVCFVLFVFLCPQYCHLRMLHNCNHIVFQGLAFSLLGVIQAAAWIHKSAVFMAEQHFTECAVCCPCPGGHMSESEFFAITHKDAMDIIFSFRGLVHNHCGVVYGERQAWCRSNSWDRERQRVS